MAVSDFKEPNKLFNLWTNTILQMGGLIIGQIFGIFFFSLFFNANSQSFENWAKALAASLIISTIAYAYFKLRKQYLKLFAYSVVNIVFLIGEIYFYVEILNWDIGFGLILIVLAGILIPINYLLTSWSNNLLKGKKNDLIQPKFL